MASENKLALLNLAARYLEPGEVYLEIGSYLGTSVIAATLGNPDKSFVAVDDFSQFGGPRRECEANIARLAGARVTLICGDAWATLSDSSFKYRVGVYFYDGGHTFADQWRALELIERHLADNALIVIDDSSHPPVSAATRAFVRRRPRFELVRHFDSEYNGEPRWWNGVDILSYCQRAAAASVGMPVIPRIVYGPPYELARICVRWIRTWGWRARHQLGRSADSYSR